MTVSQIVAGVILVALAVYVVRLVIFQRTPVPPIVVKK